MTAGQFMRRTFQVAHPESRPGQFASRSEAEDTGPLLVCENGRLIGVLGRRELAAANEGAGPRTRRMRLRDIVPRDLLYCLETTDPAEAAALMRENHVEWIPVLGSDRRPVGLLALADLPEESAATTTRGERKA
jgi:CBS domain-containing protein